MSYEIDDVVNDVNDLACRVEDIEAKLNMGSLASGQLCQCDLGAVGMNVPDLPALHLVCGGLVLPRREDGVNWYDDDAFVRWMVNSGHVRRVPDEPDAKILPNISIHEVKRMWEAWCAAFELLGVER